MATDSVSEFPMHIKNCQSVMVLSPNEIISLYGKDIASKDYEVTATQLNFDEQLILDVLGNDEVHYEQILQTTGIEQKTLLATIIEINALFLKAALSIPTEECFSCLSAFTGLFTLSVTKK